MNHDTFVLGTAFPFREIIMMKHKTALSYGDLEVCHLATVPTAAGHWHFETFHKEENF